MWTMGAGNWIKYGWGTSMNEEWVPGMQLNMDLSNRPTVNDCPHPTYAAIAAVHRIAKEYPAPYTLMCSGGLDSQTMLLSWHMSGVPFNVVSMQYKSSGMFFNDYDLVELGLLSERLDIQIDYKEFDLLTFLDSELPDVAKLNDCDSPQICTMLKAAELIKEGTILFSGNYLGVFARVNYTLLGAHRYAMRTETPNRKVIPFFLLHDPTFTTSFAAFGGKSETPARVYVDSGFPVVLPEKKFTGFEKIKEYFDKYHDDIPPMIRLKYSCKPSARAFDILYRHPYQGVLEEYRDFVSVNQILER